MNVFTVFCWILGFQFINTRAHAQVRIHPQQILPLLSYHYSEMALSDELEKKLVNETFPPPILKSMIENGKHITVTLHYVMVNYKNYDERVIVKSDYLLNEGIKGGGADQVILDTTFASDSDGSPLTAMNYHLTQDTPPSLTKIDLPLITPTSTDEPIKEPIRFASPAPGEKIPEPVLSTHQLQDLFSHPRRVMFSLVWVEDTTTGKKDSHSGDEQSKYYQKLAQHKLFSLAFADLYLINRNLLDQKATQVLQTDESFEVKIYFQRFENDLDQFGKQIKKLTDSPFEFSEAECLDWFQRGASQTEVKDNQYFYKFYKFCAPHTRVTLVKEKAGRIIKGSEKKISEDQQLLYGPGSGRQIVTAEQIISAM